MTETKTYCDHCGKQLDSMKDYCEIIVSIPGKDVYCDLCASCLDNLSDVVREYVKGADHDRP